MKRYELAVTSPEYWSEIHDALIVDSNQDGIPDRQITCTDSKSHSPTRGTYELTEEEASEIANHPHVKWIELSPTDNPDAYPKPSFATKRFKKNVKFYRDVLSSGIPSSSPTSAEENRSNYGVGRPTVRKSGEFFADNIGNIDTSTRDVSYNLTGKNVDIVIQDSGTLQYHPEFMDSNGQSRLRDIILDGPYYIDPDYFTTNGFTYTKPDGRVGIATTSAEGWWENSSNRSAAFQSEGTITIPSSYTESNAIGDSLDGSGPLTNGHGTSCASLAAGKNFGNAFEANIWNMSCVGADLAGFGIEASFDAIKIWHRNKPVNGEIGVKNPTIVNGSWGYQAAFRSTDLVDYKFRGSTGTMSGNASTTNQVTAWKNGHNNQVSGAYLSWSTSSRSSSTNAAADEMMQSGVIFVASAGNNNQRLGVGADDPDRLNYMDDDWFASGDPRSEFPGNACPTNHRDWMNPQGIGFESDKDFHPVICVGAIEDNVTNGGAEYQASYSNNGPGIDIWAPADETLAAGLISGDSADYQRYDDNRFYDTSFNGTSAAAPVVTGIIALYLQERPTATSRDVKNWIKDNGTLLPQTTDANSGDGWWSPYGDDTITSYWTGSYNLRGADCRVLYNPYANDDTSSIENVEIEGISFEIS
jgi:subtilisin family serine protease